MTPCGSNSSAQVWAYNKKDQTLTLSSTAASTPMCIDIEGYNTKPGAEVYTWPCGAGGAKENEVWIIKGAQIKSGQTPATCLSATEAAVGALVSTSDCDATDPLQSLTFDAATGLITLSGGAAPGLCVDGGSVPPPQPPWCTALPQSAWTICDQAAALDARSADIVARLSLADKIAALGTATPNLPSVGLRPYQWWSEGSAERVAAATSDAL
jgi:hypothetical protein